MRGESRTLHSVRNISVGLVSQALTMVAGFVSRTVFIHYLAVEYLGVNSLFTNILSMLSLATLGMGSAFMYSLYKPVADRDEVAIASIMRFYRKVYSAVGIAVFLIGIALIPFLDDIIPKKPEAITEDIRLIYLFFLANTAITYFFSYKVALLQASQRMSVATVNTTLFTLLQNVLQIAVLVFTSNFIMYLVVQFCCTFASNVSISRIVDKRHPYLRTYKDAVIDPRTKKSIISNTKATFLTKIGGVLVNGTDNIIINYFVGLALLGIFSNYVLLIALATNFLVIIFNNINASIANVVVKENQKKQLEVFRAINFANFWIYGFCGICVVILSNDFVTLWIGEEYVLSRDIVYILAVNFFMVGLQNAFWAFKSSYGIFRQGRYMVLGTAVLNIAFSFLLGHYFGIFGILLATALARLLTNFWFDPYIVLKNGLKTTPFPYFLKILLYFGIFAASVALIDLIYAQFSFDFYGGFAMKIFLCLIVPNVLILTIFRSRPEFRSFVSMVLNILKLRKA